MDAVREKGRWPMPGELEVASVAPEAAAPIFIRGITQRSGANFLFKLLDLHPDCRAAGPIWENYLLAKARLLVRYAESVYSVWPDHWPVVQQVGPPDLLLQEIGAGRIPSRRLGSVGLWRRARKPARSRPESSRETEGNEAGCEAFKSPWRAA